MQISHVEAEHVPVLLNEVIEFLAPKPGDFIVDGTVDGGGHAASIVEAIGASGIFLGLDWDERLLEKCKIRLGIVNKSGEDGSGAKGPKIILEHANYADLPEVLRRKQMRKPDGLLLDLGFSSEQLENSGRGFSFTEVSREEPLLMTYDDSMTPAYRILREKSEGELADIIYQLSGERFSRKIAKAIKERGRKSPLMTAGDLGDTIREALPGNYERGRINPATRTFQALRIYANGELENLKSILGSLPDMMASGGRVAIISFHSLEDKIVKQAFRELAKMGKAMLLVKKPVEASREEQKSNPRSRSAKLRVIQTI